MRAWREAYSFAAVVLVIGVVSATAIVSCGGSGSGDTNGDLCQQCGDSDGPCNANGNSVSGDDRPEGCTTDPCTVKLQCVRKVDSGQRRCFPINPTTNSLDLFYKCDGSRPALVPTSTPVPTVTLTPSATPTATHTGPTSTDATATTSGPTATPTPGAGEEVPVDITIAADADDENDLPVSLSAVVTYPTPKGSFVADGAPDCDEEDGVTFADSGGGTLTITFAGDPESLPTSLLLSCRFHQTAGEPLTNADLSRVINPDTLLITIDVEE